MGENRKIDYEFLWEICHKKRLGLIDATWNEIASQYGGTRFKNGESLRVWANRVAQKRERDTIKEQTADEPKKKKVESPKQYKPLSSFTSLTEIDDKTGVITTRRLIERAKYQNKGTNYILEAHGYDPKEWDVIRAQSKDWEVYSSQDGVTELFSSTISVKPKVFGFDYEKFLDRLETVRTIERTDWSKQYIEPDNMMLLIPFFDQHFGINTFEDYQPHLVETINTIEDKVWKKIVIIIGQDLFHNDNFRGTTSSGTVIEKVDMQQAWEDATYFYTHLIERSAYNIGTKVEVVYSKGNHDETLAWAFVKYLSALFSHDKWTNVEFETAFEEHKCIEFESVAIGVTHGDKGFNRIHYAFPDKFPYVWGNAVYREVLTGHRHHEWSKDRQGTLVRSLPTGAKTDDWHQDNAFVGARKVFQLSMYTENGLKDTLYLD